MRAPRLLVLFAACTTILAALAACTLGGPEEAGCQSDAECGEGLFCRAGACFRFIGEGAPPDEPDAGGSAVDAGA
jgi:hypothetical protein